MYLLNLQKCVKLNTPLQYLYLSFCTTNWSLLSAISNYSGFLLTRMSPRHLCRIRHFRSQPLLL